MLLHVAFCCCILCSRVKCCDVFLSAVQYFHMLHCVVEFCAAVFHVVMGSCMLCSVVTYYKVLLYAVQCC